jgi:hypothetical protein
MGKRKKQISKAWKSEYKTLSQSDRQNLGINRSNFRVEFSNELRKIK